MGMEGERGGEMMEELEIIEENWREGEWKRKR